MQLQLVNKTGSTLSYLSGAVSVSANSTVSIGDLLHQLNLSTDGQLRADIYANLIQVSDGINSYAAGDAISFLNLIPVCITSLINIRRFSMSLTTLTDAATIAVDGSLGPAYQVTLGGDHTLGNPTSQVAGQTYTFLVSQDATGGRALSYGNMYKFPNAVKPTLSTDPSALNILTFMSDGTYMIFQDAQAALQPLIVAPSSLSASNGLTGVINLTWTVNDTTATDIQVWSDASGFGFGVVGTTGSGLATSFSYSPGSPGTYDFYVVAIRGSASSDHSNQVSGSSI